MRIVIAGGTGSVGQALARQLSTQGHSVSVLTRSIRPRANFDELGISQLLWDGRTTDPSWSTELAGSVLINLAGELVDRIPTEKNIALLESSRVTPTATLARAAREFGRPALWLQMSTLAIYGDAGEQVLSEGAQVAQGPRQMAGVARSWEAAVVATDAERLVWLRTAVVLQPNTPALNRLVTITKLFLGGRISHGRQWVSWIHESDFLKAIDFIIANDSLRGPVHVTSPQQVRNHELMTALRHRLGRPWSPPTPELLVKVGARFVFRTDAQLALTGRRAEPSKLLEASFQFDFPQLDKALANLLP